MEYGLFRAKLENGTEVVVDIHDGGDGVPHEEELDGTYSRQGHSHHLTDMVDVYSRSPTGFKGRDWLTGCYMQTPKAAGAAGRQDNILVALAVVFVDIDSMERLPRQRGCGIV